MFHVRKSNQSVIRSADFHNAKVYIDFCNRIRNSADDIARLADRQGRAVSERDCHFMALTVKDIPSTEPTA